MKLIGYINTTIRVILGEVVVIKGVNSFSSIKGLNLCYLIAKQLYQKLLGNFKQFSEKYRKFC